MVRVAKKSLIVKYFSFDGSAAGHVVVGIVVVVIIVVVTEKFLQSKSPLRLQGPFSPEYFLSYLLYHLQKSPFLCRFPCVASQC